MLRLEQESQFHTGGCTGLTSGTIYFGTGQYRYIVLGILLLYIYIIIKIKVYHKTLSQFRTNYS